MSLDGFLTFVGLAIAVFAIVSPVTRLQWRLQLWPQVTAAAAAAMLVLYFLFFDVVSQPCPGWLGDNCRYLTFSDGSAFTPARASFLVVVAWLLVAVGLWKLIRPGAGSLGPMAKLMDELAYQRRYADVLEFVAPNLSLIEAAASRRLLRARFHDWVVGPSFWELVRAGAIPSDSRSTKFSLRRWLRKVARSVARFIPSMGGAQSNAQSIARVLFTNRDLRAYIAKEKPHFAARLLKLNLTQRFDFSDTFLRLMVSEQNSLLFEEIRQNQNLDDWGGYALPEHNQLLSTLFLDANVARKLAAWKPIGDALIERLDSDKTYRDYLGDSADHFDTERWSDQGFVTIRFFDIMVRAAAQQGIADHMWMYYAPTFVQKLCAAHDESREGINVAAEYPTRAASLIYETISAVGDWTKMIEHVDSGSPHSRVPTSLNDVEASIPANACICLGDCLFRVVTSENVGNDFAAYILQSVLYDIVDLRGRDDGDKFMRFLAHCAATGGRLGPSDRYAKRLYVLLQDIDHVLRSNGKVLMDEARKLYPRLGF